MLAKCLKRRQSSGRSVVERVYRRNDFVNEAGQSFSLRGSAASCAFCTHAPLPSSYTQAILSQVHSHSTLSLAEQQVQRSRGNLVKVSLRRQLSCQTTLARASPSTSDGLSNFFSFSFFSVCLLFCSSCRTTVACCTTLPPQCHPAAAAAAFSALGYGCCSTLCRALAIYWRYLN